MNGRTLGRELNRYLRGLESGIHGSLVAVLLSALVGGECRRRDGEGDDSERQVETDHIGGLFGGGTIEIQIQSLQVKS